MQLDISEFYVLLWLSNAPHPPVHRGFWLPPLFDSVFPMRVALFEPDIPQNTGTILRLAACMGVAVDIIEPCGFPFSDRSLRRAGMDYLRKVDLHRHQNFKAFDEWRQRSNFRLILLSTRAHRSFAKFEFQADDILLLGRESAGVPDSVFSASDTQLRIPMPGGLRSLNVAVAAAMVLGEALRQTGAFASATDDGIGG
jgi:tRNA (cytidine/uridine-2'-O-)-methyltransferase